MEGIKNRLKYIFINARGLVLMNIAIISLFY